MSANPLNPDTLAHTIAVMAGEKPKNARGPGHPPIVKGEVCQNYSVTLDRATLRYLRKLGGGNLSAGVRRAAALAREGRKR